MENYLIKKSKIICIIPAAGKSTRFKSGNKLYEDIIEDDGGALHNIIFKLVLLNDIDKLIVGYDEECKDACVYRDTITSIKDNDPLVHRFAVNQTILKKLSKVHFVKGGNSRQITVFNALQFVKNLKNDLNDIWILVHDAARPCITFEELVNFINRTLESDVSSIMAIPLTDALKEVDGNFKIVKTMSRKNMWLAQTPQMFKFDILFDALKYCIDNNISITDESEALEISGQHCRVHIGKSHNIKITYKSDLEFAKYVLSAIQKKDSEVKND